jgi:hypothetical protein
MSLEQTIVWTALPHGVIESGGEKRLRLSLVASPRLRTDMGDKLKYFKEHFLDWPATVRAMKFELQFSPGPIVSKVRRIIPEDSSEEKFPSSELWSKIFNGDTYVRPYEFPAMEDKLIYSYPVGNVAGFIKKLYSATAVFAGETYPANSAILNPETFGAIVNHRGENNFRTAVQVGGIQPAKESEKLKAIMTAPTRLKGGARGKPATNNAVPPSAPDTAFDFFQFQNFHQVHSKQDPEFETTDAHGVKGYRQGKYHRLPAAIPKPKLDFHQVIGSFGDYPMLQRMLGLVIDVEIPLDGVPETSGALQSVQVIPHYPASIPAPHPTDIKAKTYYVLSLGKHIFKPRPREVSPEFNVHGLFNINEMFQEQRVYHIEQMDLDGAVFKAMNFAYTLYYSMQRRTADSPEESSIPSLTTGGISVSRTGSAYRLSTLFQGASNTNAALPAEPSFFAEDVIRGYRMDVHDNTTNAWRSLYQREGTYKIGGDELKLLDEGFTQLATGSSADGSSPDLYLHESFLRWDGWSLAAPKPGAAMDNEGATQPSDNLNPPNADYPVHPTFKAYKGSLPKLRLGRKYRLRIRGVDLAGNSAAFNEMAPDDKYFKYAHAIYTDPIKPTDFSAATDELLFNRFEPIISPAVVLKQDIKSIPEGCPVSDKYADASGPNGVGSAGESIERIVIRTYNDEPTKNTTDTPEKSRRHFAAPASSVTMAELYGRLDVDLSSPDSKGKLLDQQKLLIKKADAKFDQTPAAKAGDPIIAIYPIDKNDAIAEIPYLPDPGAKGVSFVNLPGVAKGKRLDFSKDDTLPSSPALPMALPTPAADSVTLLDFKPGSDWYDPKTIQLLLTDGTTAGNKPPQLSSDGRSLTVYLPKAEVIEVPFASILSNADLENMGIWRWLADIKPELKLLPYLRRMALDGRHWMITPHRKLVLVHATQKPLAAPAYTDLKPSKYLGDTYATLYDSIKIHGKSTSKVDIKAEWTMWVDDLRDPGPKKIAASAHVAEIKVEDVTLPTLDLHHQHNLGDTKFRRINYTAIATTRFREYFPAKITADEKNIQRNSNDALADGKYVAPNPLNILNSARPDIPKLLYVVPTFGWDRKSATKGAYSKRTGGGLRVYMDRPWFSSGDDERLGVMIWTGPFKDIEDKNKPFVTQWGTDPIWLTGGTTTAPSEASFPRHREVKYDVTLDELADHSKTLEYLQLVIGSTYFTDLAATDAKQTKGTQTTTTTTTGGGRAFKKLNEKPLNLKDIKFVEKPNYSIIAKMMKPTLAVVGHDVMYDADRQLWFSDIEIDTGTSYFPFVRLALVRFQPNSVEDAFISRVVLADFAQLTPDRNLAVIFDPANPKLIVVAVSGITYTNSSAEQRGSQVEVSIETRRPDVMDPAEDLGWAQVPDATFELTALVNEQGIGVWTGIVTLPEPRGSRPFRIVVKEFERFASDKDENPMVNRAKQIKGDRRVVYAETVEI